MKKPWTKEEIEKLKELFPHESTALVAEKLNCSYTRVANKAFGLKLKKSKEYRQKQIAESGELMRKLGVNSRFQNGMTPPNKGKKMPAEIYQRCQATMFKKGNQPHNTKHDLAISKRWDKTKKPYLFIRIALAKWIPLQRYVWEQYRGPLQPKTKVRFIDGNTLNCNIENLEVVSNADHLRKNSAHRFGPEIFKVIQLRGALHRQINKHLKRLQDEKQNQ